MKNFPIFKKAALALAAVGMLASAAAHADSLVVDQPSTLGFKVDVAGATRSIDTGLLNVTDTTTGSSFLAFCYELLQGLSVAAFTSGETYTPGANLSPAVQTLYNQSFGSLNLTSAVEVAGFQIALWEALDNSDLSSGTLNNWTGAHTGSALPADQQAIADETEALDNAWLYLQKLTQNYPAPGNFALTTWSSPNSQDLIQASTATNRVPEPTTLMLGALGLAGLSAVRRRKS